MENKLEKHKPGDLCMDKDRLCVLVKIGQSTDIPATKFLKEINLLEPYGWFLDLKDPILTFNAIDYVFKNSSSWKCDIFNRNLDVVKWL